MTDVSKYTLRVTWDQVNSLVVDELKHIRDDIKRYMDGDKIAVVFDRDPVREQVILKAHYDAAVLLLSYYGVEE